LTSKEKIFESYGIERPFAVEVLGSPPRLWPKSFFSALRLRKLIKREPPETVFYIRDFLLAYFLSFLSRHFRKNYFIECHALDKFPRFIYRRVLRHARGIISSNTAKEKEIVARYHVAASYVLTAPNGFDEKFFDTLPSREEARRICGLPCNKKIVLYAGSLLSWKGADIIGDIANKLPGILFVILGSHEDKEEGNVLSIKKQDFRRVPMYLRAADLLLAPYRTDSVRAQYYFSPIKVFEYMASATPFLVSDLPAIREFLSEKETFFVPAHKAEDWARAIQFAMDHPEEREQRAREALVKSAKFSWQNRAKRIVEFIGEGIQ
jgi:glycosyltransferase involved in cell wall biosynthesis